MLFILKNQLNSQRGANLLEYVLLISLITLVAVGAATYFSDENKKSLNCSSDTIAASMQGAELPPDCPQ